MNGRVVSAIVSIIVMVLFAWNLFSKQNPPPGQPGVLIAFGAEDLGMNDDENPSSDEPVEEPREVSDEVEEVSEPDPVEPTPTETDVTEDVVTDDNSDAPPVKPTKPKPKPKPEPKKPTTEPKKEPKKPIPGGQLPKKTDGKGKGDNNKPGPTGDPDGSGDSQTGGITAGGDVGGGLSGRGVLKPGVPKNNTGQFGTVVIKLCVNPDGNVIEANYTQRGSTTANSELVKIAKQAAKRYKFKKNPYAPDKQCGTVTYKFLPG